MGTKVNNIIYWVSTGLMCLIFLYSAGMYFFKYEMVVGVFENLGFASWIVYPLAVAKILGVVAVLTKKSKLLKEWAYAGFFFDAVLAFFAHYMAGDGQGGSAAVVVILILLSRYFDGRVNN